jgi:hypothetical protein
MLALFSQPNDQARPASEGPARVSGLRVVGPDHPRRAAVEAFVHGIYRVRFGATVRKFAPQLVALCDEAGEIVAVAGYRSAESGTLFLERYLAAPVEALLGAESPDSPSRECIVEVGHLAASCPGAGRRLILLLGPHLAAQGFQWVVGTLTEELRHLFVRLGIVPLALGAADPALLGDEATDWGRYYEHRPVVLAGQLDAALQTLARRRVLS